MKTLERTPFTVVTDGPVSTRPRWLRSAAVITADNCSGPIRPQLRVRPLLAVAPALVAAEGGRGWLVLP